MAIFKNLNEAETALVESIVRVSPAAVAFSGGVDSMLLAKAAMIAAERHSLPFPRAILAVSATSSADDVENAYKTAEEIGISLCRIDTGELNLPEFVRNGRDRCYHCKKQRFSEMLELLRVWEKEDGIKRTLLDGENADDLAAYRPGHRAAEELGVRSPIADSGINKETVRKLARRWGLSAADRPSTPCLVTRLAYGITPEPELLRAVEKAEQLLRRFRFPICRVRVDLPDSARIEVPAVEISRLLEADTREKIAKGVKAAGFTVVSIDLEGFASGKMDSLAFL